MFLEYLYIWEVSHRNPWGSPWRYGVPCEPVWVVKTRCMCIWCTAHSTSSYMCIWCTTYSIRSSDTLQRIEEEILSWIFNITHESRQHVSYSIFANWDSDITGPMSLAPQIEDSGFCVREKNLVGKNRCVKTSWVKRKRSLGCFVRAVESNRHRASRFNDLST